MVDAPASFYSMSPDNDWQAWTDDQGRKYYYIKLNIRATELAKYKQFQINQLGDRRIGTLS